MHEAVTRFAQLWGMFYAVAIFAVALIYALWPSNKQTFERAAHAPLDTDEDDNAGQG